MEHSTNIGYLLHHLASTLDRQSEQVLQERLGIGMSQFKILMALRWDEQFQQRHIAECLGQTEASISRQVKLMHDKGLLKSAVSEANRREHITTPTLQGAKATDDAMELLNAYHEPMFARLSEKQHEQLREILQVMHESSCSWGKAGACHIDMQTK